MSSSPVRAGASPAGDDLMLLFVYGTLKSGQRNNRYYLQGQRCLGPARTTPGYRLYNCGTYPGLVADSSGSSVSGEIWEVEERRMDRIDGLEGVEEGLFARARIQLVEPEVMAVAYLYQQSIEGLAQCGPSWEE